MCIKVRDLIFVIHFIYSYIPRLVSDYKKKLASVGGSGQTGPPNTSDENIIR